MVAKLNSSTVLLAWSLSIRFVVLHLTLDDWQPFVLPSKPRSSGQVAAVARSGSLQVDAAAWQVKWLQDLC